jgi:L-alanine-DL-glutamate epimerase-like enolase superfamily enzyme
MRIAAVNAHVLKLDGPDVYLGTLSDGSTPRASDGYVVREPWRSLYSARFETMLVSITAEDGTTGWGEALAPVGPEIPATIVRTLLAPVLTGAGATAVRPLAARLRDLMRERGHLAGHQADALAAVDIALWDLCGRLTGRRVADLLGGAFRETVPTYVSGLPAQGDEERVALAREWMARGARRIKLHLGYGVKADAETFRRVGGVHPELRVAVDAHWAYTVGDALRLGRVLDRGGALFLEAPLVPEDVDGHRELARRLATPVAVGETLRNRYEFRDWLRSRALALAQPDVARTGITEAMAIAELAGAFHVPVAPHHSVGLGVSMAAGIHLAAAIEHAPFFEFQPSTMPVAERILRAPLGGGPVAFAVPEGPGLGIDVDAELVTELAKET